MDMATNMWLKDMAWERRDEPIDRSSLHSTSTVPESERAVERRRLMFDDRVESTCRVVTGCVRLKPTFELPYIVSIQPYYVLPVHVAIASESRPLLLLPPRQRSPAHAHLDTMPELHIEA